MRTTPMDDARRRAAVYGLLSGYEFYCPLCTEYYFGTGDLIRCCECDFVVCIECSELVEDVNGDLRYICHVCSAELDRLLGEMAAEQQKFSEVDDDRP